MIGDRSGVTDAGPVAARASAVETHAAQGCTFSQRAIGSSRRMKGKP